MKKLMSGVFILALLVIANISVSPEPVSASKMVTHTNLYTYDMMTTQLKQLEAAYPDAIHLESIGKTPYQRNIWAVRVGHGEANIFINGAHHGREWITTLLTMTMIETYAKSYTEQTHFQGYATKELLDQVSIWFVPMVNPDGVTLQQFGLSAFPKADHAKLIQMNSGSRDFTRWKANAQGIDLNRQYDADWSRIRGNVKHPSWMNHKGPKPHFAPEVKAIVDFTYRIKPEIAVAYHSSGEILFWYFHNDASDLPRDKRLARIYSQITGYSLVKPTRNPSGGGYTDWFIQQFKKPGFTPEVSKGVGNQHVPVKYFSNIWSQNDNAGIWLASEAYKMWYPEASKNQKVVTIDNMLLLDEEETFYQYPNILRAGQGKLKQEKIRVVAQKGDWYKVNTWLGYKWIYVPDAVFEQPAIPEGEAEQENQKEEVTDLEMTPEPDNKEEQNVKTQPTLE
ncbi:M14 family metallopeptidase [Paenibacillus agilis]|uniref:Peptidase M14 domain-containing protein n=1 Tax=Paenibacillus agilis TaxID=3020863 RepID=A0A559IWS3_9BACL|nr:M14 family metallocarboxypeptidase [Paenibacillus agilis]TVX92084.1 hypothetical protein FPZ44_02835 [Paenibacillus agilis]